MLIYEVVLLNGAVTRESPVQHRQEVLLNKTLAAAKWFFWQLPQDVCLLLFEIVHIYFGNIYVMIVLKT